jgi:hypothetical protein
LLNFPFPNYQNFPFPNYQNFPFQTIKIFLSKLSKFSFSKRLRKNWLVCRGSKNLGNTGPLTKVSAFFGGQASI